MFLGIIMFVSINDIEHQLLVRKKSDRTVKFETPWYTVNGLYACFTVPVCIQRYPSLLPLLILPH